MKVDGFSQAMEFEEHRGTVIYSTVNNMFGQLCWRSLRFVDLMHHFGITLFLIRMNPPAESKKAKKIKNYRNIPRCPN